jgi:C-terminal processing protease CtpA/Prc
VGIIDSTYLPGAKLGTIMEGTVAERAGLRKGDIIMRVGDLDVAPSPEAVNQVVDTIR